MSECVGLDIEDVDFKNNGIKVLRKGGNEMFVYFGDEVAEALKKYIEVRAGITPVAGHEHALFYSAQRKRINVKTVENPVSYTHLAWRVSGGRSRYAVLPDRRTVPELCCRKEPPEHQRTDGYPPGLCKYLSLIHIYSGQLPFLACRWL